MSSTYSNNGRLRNCSLIYFGVTSNHDLEHAFYSRIARHVRLKYSDGLQHYIIERVEDTVTDFSVHAELIGLVYSRRDPVSFAGETGDKRRKPSRLNDKSIIKYVGGMEYTGADEKARYALVSSRAYKNSYLPPVRMTCNKSRVTFPM